MTNKDNLEDRKQKLKQQVIEFYTSKQITKQTKDSALDQLENMDKIKPDHYIFCNRSEEHTSELQSHHDLVCRLLLEKKKTIKKKKKKIKSIQKSL